MTTKDQLLLPGKLKNGSNCISNQFMHLNLNEGNNSIMPVIQSESKLLFEKREVKASSKFTENSGERKIDGASFKKGLFGDTEYPGRLNLENSDAKQKLKSFDSHANKNTLKLHIQAYDDFKLQEQKNSKTNSEAFENFKKNGKNLKSVKKPKTGWKRFFQAAAIKTGIEFPRSNSYKPGHSGSNQTQKRSTRGKKSPSSSNGNQTGRDRTGSGNEISPGNDNPPGNEIPPGTSGTRRKSCLKSNSNQAGNESSGSGNGISSGRNEPPRRENAGFLTAAAATASVGGGSDVQPTVFEVARPPKIIYPANAGIPQPESSAALERSPPRVRTPRPMSNHQHIHGRSSSIDRQHQVTQSTDRGTSVNAATANTGPGSTSNYKLKFSQQQQQPRE